jgi:flavin-binding protein dodecin
MSIVKVIELIAESTESWEAAAQEAVSAATKTISQVKSVYIEDFQAIVEGNKIVKYRVTAKITFIITD